MKSNRVNYLVVGTFVIGMLVALVVTVAALTGRTGATDTYFTLYKDISGIKFGTQVLYMGYPVGQVEEVTPEWEDGQTTFRLALSVIEGWKIPEDSIAKITSAGLLAAPTIDIRAGESKTMLKPGAQIEGVAAVNLFAAISKAANTIMDLTEKSVKPLLTNVNRYLDSLGGLIETDAHRLMADLNSVASELASEAPRIIADVREFSADLRKTGNHLDELTGDRTRSKVDTALMNFEKASTDVARLTNDLHATRAKLDHLLEEYTAVVTENRPDIDQSVGDLRHTLHTVAQHINSVAYNLEGTSRNMYEFSRQIRQNPGLLLGGKPPKDTATKTSQ